MLTLDDFKSDYQHLVVRAAKWEEVVEHIEEHYPHIKEDCLNWLRRK